MALEDLDQIDINKVCEDAIRDQVVRRRSPELTPQDIQPEVSKLVVGARFVHHIGALAVNIARHYPTPLPLPQETTSD